MSGRGHKASRKGAYGGGAKRSDEAGRRRAEGIERTHAHEPEIVIDETAKPKVVRIRDGRADAC